MRATLCFAAGISAVFSSFAVACLKRRSNSSFLVSASLSFSSSMLSFLSSAAFILEALPNYDRGLHGELMSGAGQSLASQLKVYPFDFVKYTAGLHRSVPTHRSAFTFTLTGFKRLGGV